MDSGSETEGHDGDGKRGWKEEKARCADAKLTTTIIPRVQPPRPSPNRCIVFGSGGGRERRCFNCNGRGHIALVCTTCPHHPHHTRSDHHKLDEIKRKCAELEERERRLVEKRKEIAEAMRRKKEELERKQELERQRGQEREEKERCKKWEVEVQRMEMEIERRENELREQEQEFFRKCA